MAIASAIPIWKSLQEITDKRLDKIISIIYNENRKRQDRNGYAQRKVLNNPDFWTSGGYFFMEITNSNRIIINEIMYSLSIAITPFRSVA